MRILVADDDEVVRAVLVALLEHLGHEVVLASDGTEAWAIIQREDAPSLVILDWMMPGIDGVEICRRLRQSAKRPYQYLLMLTAKDEMQDLVESIESGADDYLRKPFDARELRARLHAGQRILVLQDELRVRATIDDLTGLWNRAAVLDILKRELELSKRNGVPLSILLADLDHFKRINDTHGHAVGDEVLREASKRMAARLRPYDELGRYGGEEFLVVLPGCTSSAALSAAHRVKEAVSAVAINTAVGPITVSIGVASAAPGDTIAADRMVIEADKALYRAKRAGRDRVETA
jgi:diguanylate cyclase (GGDEF)-like protein